MDRRRATGVGAVLVTNGGILLAALLSPAFSVTGNALSNLGVAATPAGTLATALLFNGGLVCGSLLGVGFAATLFADGRRVVGPLLAATTALMGLVGVFPQDRALHLPVAVGFYLLVTATLWADGVGAWRGGRDPRPGLALGAANLAGWVGWGLTGPVRRAGLAVPELVGAVAFSAWVLNRAGGP